MPRLTSVALRCVVTASAARRPYHSAEWEIRLYARYIRLVHERCFAQTAFALCTFRGQQMTSRRMRSQNLAARRDFKTLRYCFTCFASRNGLRHKGRKITQLAIQRIKDLTIDRKMSEIEGGFTRRGQIAKSLNHLITK
jgi:hypothetical protein